MDVNKPFNILVQSGWGDLIPYEAKRKLINHSTYLFRGVGGFDPLSREVEVNKLFNILVQRGDLIPHEEKWKLIYHSTYLFRGGDLIPYEHSIPQ